MVTARRSRAGVPRTGVPVGSRRPDRVSRMARAGGAPAIAPTDGAEPAPARRCVRRWLWVHLASMAVAVPVLAWVNRDQWFSGDEWQLVTSNGLGANPARSGLFAPHFEHWITLGILVYKVLYGVFAARTYVPYVVALIAVILAVAHLSWRLFLRIGVSPPLATAAAALTMVMAVGWENRSTAFQMVVIGPVALGFGALLVMPTTGPLRRRDAVVVALLLLGLMCSGTGVTMTVVVALAALLRRGWKVAAGIVAVPAVAYCIWYLAEGSAGQRDNTPMSTVLRDLPGFVWRGITSALDDLTRVEHTGVLLLVLVVIWLGWKVWQAGPRREPWPLVLATTVGALASVTLTGLRRATAPPVSRYSDIIVLLALPALVLMVQDGGRWLARHVGRPVVAVVSVVVVVFLVVQVVALNDEIEGEIFVGEMEPRVLATARILRDHDPIASTNIFGIPFLNEPSTSTIARLDRNGDLPALDVSRADVLTARAYVQTVVGDASKYPEGRARTVTVSDGSSGAAGAGCLSIAPATPGRRPVVLVELPAAGSFRVATDRDATASLAWVQRSTHGRPRLFTTTPGGGTGVGVAQAANLELTLPATTTTLCGLGSAAIGQG